MMSLPDVSSTAPGRDSVQPDLHAHPDTFPLDSEVTRAGCAAGRAEMCRMRGEVGTEVYTPSSAPLIDGWVSLQRYTCRRRTRAGLIVETQRCSDRATAGCCRSCHRCTTLVPHSCHCPAAIKAEVRLFPNQSSRRCRQRFQDTKKGKTLA